MCLENCHKKKNGDTTTTIMKAPFEEDHMIDDKDWFTKPSPIPSKLRELSLHVIPEDSEWCCDDESDIRMTKEQNDESAVAWVAICRNDIVLVDIGEENETVMDVAHHLMEDLEPAIGWDEFDHPDDDDSHNWKGLRFHIYEETADKKGDILVWVLACVYNTEQLSALQAREFVQTHMVQWTESFRRTDPTWREGGYHACQCLFATALHHRMEDCHEACFQRNKSRQLRQRMGLEEDDDEETKKVDFSLTDAIVEKNQEIVEKHIVMLEEEVVAEQEEETSIIVNEEEEDGVWQAIHPIGHEEDDGMADLETAAFSATSAWRCTNPSFFAFDEFHRQDADGNTEDINKNHHEISSVEEEDGLEEDNTEDRIVSPVSIKLEQIASSLREEFSVVQNDDDDSDATPDLVESSSSLSTCDESLKTRSLSSPPPIFRSSSNNDKTDQVIPVVCLIEDQIDEKYSDLWEASPKTISAKKFAAPPPSSPAAVQASTPTRKAPSSPTNTDSLFIPSLSQENSGEDDGMFQSPESSTPKKVDLDALASSSPTGIADFPDLYEEFPKPFARKPLLTFCLGKTLKTRRRESHDISDGRNCFWCSLFAPKESTLV